jgi:acetolactate synthase-1/2/3 large subunit
MKYSDLMLDWLQEAGYRACFFVAGGNIMHLLESARHRFACHAFVHEVAAVVAAEYFNEVADGARAFALVTAGPGLTNAITGLAGAYLESRFVLVLGGQVKSSDLAGAHLRQRGIQEVDGIALARPVTVCAARIERPMERRALERLIGLGTAGRPGPVFLEVCLDAQGATLEESQRAELSTHPVAAADRPASAPAAWQDKLRTLLAASRRPVLLLGGGVRRAAMRGLLPALSDAALPVMTTWNGADRIAADHPLYFGRPNTWGQRYSNILLQQADLVLALGTRLGLQQTGFNWQLFAPAAAVVQVDLDAAELAKGHPRIELPIQADAAAVLDFILRRAARPDPGWLAFCREVKQAVPEVEPGINRTGEAYLSPYEFVAALSGLLRPDDVAVPCSSGGAFTVMMQAFAQQAEQRVITNKGLASMGYGLSGALGAAFAAPDRRVILVEGDGGFTQNLQELGTVMVNRPNLKIFIFDDGGYASIRMTQRNYFGGEYMGCDTNTGLGLPHWPTLFAAYGIGVQRLARNWEHDPTVRASLEAPGAAAFLVPIDPEQTYFPKISSRVTESGAMVSNPLHAMTPPLPAEIASRVFRYISPPASP